MYLKRVSFFNTSIPGSVAELQTACKDRGMRAVGLTQDKLRQQLKQWIELSTNEKVGLLKNNVN